MSYETIGRLADEDSVIHCSSAALFPITEADGSPADGEVDAWEVPRRHIEDVAEALLKTLGEIGVDPNAVLFSGYSSYDAEPDHTADLDEDKHSTYSDKTPDLQDRIERIAKKMVALDTRGLLTDSKKQSYLERIAGLRADIKREEVALRPVYFFADAGALTGGSDGQYFDKNPILYAGSDEEATIGVYYRAKLSEFSGGEFLPYEIPAPNENEYTVEAAFADIQRAKILEFHPRYIHET